MGKSYIDYGWIEGILRHEKYLLLFFGTDFTDCTDGRKSFRQNENEWELIGEDEL